MQLKNPRSIRHALGSATCSLLGVTASLSGGNAIAELATQNVDIDSALLIYSETNRVTAVEPVLSIRKEIGQDEYVTVKLVADSLTGSSPNGATPSASTQTFTSPSGNDTYEAAPGETPLDPTFKDTRGAAIVDWERPLGERLKGVFGANLSSETDYTSLGASATLSQDLNQRLTTLTAGMSLSLDTINPVGGIPLALTAMPGPTDPKKQTAGSDDTKNSYDMLLGVTQVLNRRSLMQLNYSYGTSSGYHTDPYKILSVVDPTITDPAISNVTSYVYESRPDKRVNQSLYWKMVHQFTDDVFDISYRYYWDDWGVDSQTVDLHYRYELGHSHYLQPHVRYYRQSAADFYRYFLTDVELAANPRFASADYRLGDLTTTTFGLLYGYEMGKRGTLTVRAELMTQSGEGHPAEAIGNLRQQNLFEDVKATIVQVGYSFKF